MQIQKCIITKPGLLSNRILSFNNGVTIVQGKNDSGKSLLSRALVDALWGGGGGSYMLNGTAWDDLYIEIFFNTDSGQYRFIRDGRRSFRISEIEKLVETVIFQKVIDSGAGFVEGGSCDIPASLKKDKEAERLFGKINTEIFRNISFMPSPMEIAQDGKIDSSAFEWLILDDRSNFYSIYQSIAADFRKGGHDRGSSNYMLTEILNAESAVKDADRKIQISEIQTSKSERLREEERRRAEEIESISRELTDIRSAKSALSRVQDELKKLEVINASLKNKMEELAAEEEKSSSCRKLVKETDDRFRQFRNYDETNIANLKKIEDAYRDVRNIHESIEKHDMEVNKRKARFKRLIVPINIYLLIIIIALFSLSSDRIQILKFYKYYFAGVIMLLSVLISLFISFFYFISFRGKEEQKLNQDRADIETRLKGLLNVNKITLDEYRLETLYEFLVQYFEDYAEFTIRQSELNSMKKSLKDDSYLQALKEDVSKLEKDADNIKAKVAAGLENAGSYGEIEPDAGLINNRIQELNGRIKTLKESIKSNEEIIVQIKQEAGHKKNNTDEKARLEAEKVLAEKDLKYLMNYKNSIAYIMEIMELAIKS
ncbi:MAG: hypothetical protein MUC95_09160, partial [Spirochaetes bacterium]|nr:hypothetical protein [Spirochaetota bacterium]